MTPRMQPVRDVGSEQASALLRICHFPKKAKASSSFLKKKTKNLLTPLSRRCGESRDSQTKAFCSFFSKKKSFLAFDSQDLGIEKLGSSGKQNFLGEKGKELFPALSRTVLDVFGQALGRAGLAIGRAGLAISLLAWPAAAQAAACTMSLVSRLPVQAYGGHVLVDATFNDKPAKLIFDTGAYESIITSQAASRLGLRVMRREEGDAGPRRVGGIGGGRGALEMTARSVNLGGLRARDYDFVAADVVGPPADGLLSVSVISQFDIDLDFAEQQILLFRPSGDCSAPAAFLASPLYNVPMRPTGQDRRPRVVVQVGNQNLVALVDTGAAHSVIFRRAAQRLGLNLETLSADRQVNVSGVGLRRVSGVRHVFEPVTIGDLEFSNMQVDILDDEGLDEVEMVLGADFLRQVHVWISYSSHNLILQYPPRSSKKVGAG